MMDLYSISEPGERYETIKIKEVNFMSIESAMRFFMSMEMNSELKNKYLGVISDVQKHDEAEKDKVIEQEILPLAKEAGFEFSIAELKEFQATLKEGKLSDDDLEQVVGGYVQLRYPGCIHCFKYDDPEYIRKAMASDGFSYVCPGYSYHPHFSKDNRCDSCENGCFRG
jgi:predicted ribosomally synthesized peptide with nif11-like leader